MELLCCSDIHYWVSHWDPQRRRSVRCGGSGCYGCQQGAPKIVRGVVLGVDTQGRDRLFEVRQRHENVFESYETTVGLRISIRKLGAATNSPVEVKVVGEEYAYRRDITRLVDSLGEKPVMLSACEQEFPERSRPSDRLDDSGDEMTSASGIFDHSDELRD